MEGAVRPRRACEEEVHEEVSGWGHPGIFRARTRAHTQVQGVSVAGVRAHVLTRRAMLLGCLLLLCLIAPASGIRYFFCSGGGLEDGQACQGLADTITCGIGGTCVEDMYIDPCGNGFKLSGEECDDGNSFDGDGCSSTCTVETGFECTGGSSRAADVCTVVCGDGVLISEGCCYEEGCSRECSEDYGCDDGNTVDGDGCSHACSIEPGFECWGGTNSTMDMCLCTRSSVSAGFTHSCSLNQQYQIECWGDPENNKTKNDFDERFGAYAWPIGSWNVRDIYVSVTAGSQHNCAMKYDGFMICWGWIGVSTLGDGRLNLPMAPDWARNSDGGFTWESVFSGFAFNCGVMKEARFRYRPVCSEGETPGATCLQQGGKDRCFGCRAANDWNVDWLERHPCFLSYVDQNNCSVPSNKTMLCWGPENSGESSSFPVRSDWIQVSTGSFHACGVTSDGAGHCWGNNQFGQTRIPFIGRKWIQLAAGGAHTCGIDENFKMHCWGRNREGQTDAPCDDFWLRVDAGGLHTCGIHMDLSMECWGGNNAGQSNVPYSDGTCKGGVNATRPCSTHAGCPGGRCEGHKKRDWEQAGDLHTCAVDRSRNVFCWGSNLNGEVSLPGGVTVVTGYGLTGQAQFDSRGYKTATCL